MRPIADLYTELDYLSSTISTQVRTIAAGVLAIGWAIMVPPATTALADRDAVVWPVMLSLLSLICDLAQYLFGYWNNGALRRRLEAEGAKEFTYDTRTFSYRLRAIFFWLKIGTGLGGAVWLLIVLAKAVYPGASP